MRKFLIKVSSSSGPSFQVVNEVAVAEVRGFCEKVGYGCKVIGTGGDDRGRRRRPTLGP